jgi:4-hydroxy-tetrahydrodipicolinate synthase
MNLDEVKSTLRGPMIPVITNLKDDLAVDHDAIADNVRTIVARGIVRGRGVLLAVGAGGDFPMLTVEERKAAARTIVEAAAGKTPIVVGAQDTNPQVSIELARYSEGIGAYAVQMSPTFYYESSDEDCLRVFQAVHDATSTLALMIYNTWWESYDMSLEQVRRLAELERCVALKWSTPAGGAAHLKGVAAMAGSLAVVDNGGMQVSTHMLGGTGYVTHLATVWPEHDLAVWDLLESGDYVAAQQKITAVNWPWGDFRSKMWKRTAAESPVVKAALEICGRPGGPTRLPARALSASECDELRGLLRRIGVPDVR